MSIVIGIVYPIKYSFIPELVNIHIKLELELCPSSFDCDIVDAFEEAVGRNFINR
ncbi:MAG TPA: hypothetical protein VGO47_14665 [Chlamydiales bacterium]|nr:hypothetical protein [Chlamydiales bacterium]